MKSVGGFLFAAVVLMVSSSQASDSGAGDNDCTAWVKSGYSRLLNRSSDTGVQTLAERCVQEKWNQAQVDSYFKSSDEYKRHREQACQMMIEDANHRLQGGSSIQNAKSLVENCVRQDQSIEQIEAALTSSPQAKSAQN